MCPQKTSQSRESPYGTLALAKHLNDPDDIHGGITRIYRQVLDVRVRKEYRRDLHASERVALKTVTLRRFLKGGIGFSAVSGDSIYLGFPTKGGISLTAGRQHVQSKPYEVGDAIPLEQPFDLEMAPASILYLLEVSRSDISTHAEALLGDQRYRGPGSIKVDLRTGPGAAYVRNTLHVFREIDTLKSSGLSLAGLASFEEHLLNLVIYATRPDLIAIGNREKEAAPALVQRAMEYLAARAATPVRIADVAAAMSVSARALQMGFRQHVGCSPLEFLQLRRLELAHIRLLSAQPEENVSSIAADCGFINLGAFAQRYRAVYGDLPSHTLRQSLARR